MARSISVHCHHYRDDKKEREAMMHEMVAAVNDNFAAFRSWAEKPQTTMKGKPIMERFLDNYQTFRGW